MIVMAVTNDDGVDNGDVLELARRLGISSRTDQGSRPWRAARLEYGIEEHAHARWELDVVAGVA